MTTAEDTAVPRERFEHMEQPSTDGRECVSRTTRRPAPPDGYRVTATRQSRGRTLRKENYIAPHFKPRLPRDDDRGGAAGCRRYN